ncbi:YqjF family protein [Virgibacillus sp. FSP13]
MYKDILKSTRHREYPMPQGPWVMMQKWEHMLFLNWPVTKHVMEAQLPPGLELDTYDGDAWISVIPFKVSKMRLRKMPKPPYFGSFLELNVRTYVKRDGIRGVYFFGLDASKLFTVLGARMATLPYFYGSMAMKQIEGSYHFYSKRQGKEPANFRGSYKPMDDLFIPDEGSIPHWLLERYYLWTYRNGSLYRGAIHHKKWEVQNAKVNLDEQSYTSFLPDNSIGSEPLMYYAPSKVALNWLIKKDD